MRYRPYLPLMLFSLLIWGCGKKETPPQGSGLIEATEVIVSAEAAGRIETLYTHEGQSVQVGDTLAMIDTTNVMLRLRQARAALEAAGARIDISSINIKQAANNLDLANKEFERVATLIKTGSINQQQYDQAESARNQARLAREQADASLKAARADLNNASAQQALLEKQLSDCFPAAPQSGVIVDSYVEAGELIAPGKPLVRIASLETVWVKIYVPPSDLTRISLGGHAAVDPEDGRGQLLDGVISWISNEAEFTPKNVQTKEARAGLLYAVKIAIPNPEGLLKIGMPVSVLVR